MTNFFSFGIHRRQFKSLLEWQQSAEPRFIRDWHLLRKWLIWTWPILCHMSRVGNPNSSPIFTERPNKENTYIISNVFYPEILSLWKYLRHQILKMKCMIGVNKWKILRQKFTSVTILKPIPFCGESRSHPLPGGYSQRILSPIDRVSEQFQWTKTWK